MSRHNLETQEELAGDTSPAHDGFELEPVFLGALQSYLMVLLVNCLLQSTSIFYNKEKCHSRSYFNNGDFFLFLKTNLGSTIHVVPTSNIHNDSFFLLLTPWKLCAHIQAYYSSSTPFND